MATQISIEDFEKALDENWTQEYQKIHLNAMFYDREWTELDADVYAENSAQGFPGIYDFVSSLEVSDEDLDDLFDDVAFDVY